MTNKRLLRKYRKGLKKARRDTRYDCHVLGLERTIERLKEPGYVPTAAEAEWIDCFNRQ